MANATKLPALVLFQWAKPDAPNPRLAAPISSTDTVILFTNAPKDKSGTTITGNFVFGVRNSLGYVENIYVPPGGVSGFTATGCVRGVGTSGLDYTTGDPALAAEHEQDSPVSCNVTAVFSSIMQAVILGTSNIATGGLSFVVGDGTDTTVTIKQLDGGGVVGFLRKEFPTEKVQFSNDGSTWTDVDEGLIRVTSADTTPGYLDDKISVVGLTKTILNPGGNEEIQLTGTGPAAVQNNELTFAVATGAVNTYAIALTPTLTSYVLGQEFTFQANLANTGAATLNVDGLGAQNLVNIDGSPLAPLQIPAGAQVKVAENGGTWQVLSVTDVVAGSSGIASCILEEDMTAGQTVGVSTYISQADIYVSPAFKTTFTATLGSVANTILGLLRLDDTRLFVLYQTTAGNLLSGVVLTYDQDISQITAVGTKVDFTTAALNVTPGLCLLDTDKVAVSYAYTATDTVIRIKPATITGAVITLGAEQTLVTLAGASNNTQMVAVGTNKAVVYAYAATPANSRVAAFSVSGTTITAGADVTPTGNVRSDNTKLTRLDTDRFILTNVGTGTTGYINVGTIATVTVTLSSEQTFTTGGSTNGGFTIEAGVDKIVLNYLSTGSSSSIDRFVVISVSGTTATAGTPVAAGFTVSGIGLCKGETSSTFYFYISSSGNNGTVLRGTISGTTITLATVSNFEFPFDTANNTVVVINGRLVGVNSVSSTTLTFSRTGLAYTFVGVLLESGSRGDTKPVKLKATAMGGQSGLYGGEYYSLYGELLSSSNTNNGVAELVRLGSTNAQQNTINATFLALKEDTIIAL